MNDDSANNDDVNRPDWLGMLAIIILIAFLAPALLAALLPIAVPLAVVLFLVWLIFRR
jgi:hypothetical protein